jgi:hypothetical protein
MRLHAVWQVFATVSEETAAIIFRVEEILLASRWKQVPSKQWYLLIKLHIITSQETVLFIVGAMKT